MKRVLLVGSTFLALIVAQPVFADCGGDCVNSCSGYGSGKAYADCLRTCIAGCPAPDVPTPSPPQPVKTK